jgi:hypothetical protein
VRIGDERPCLAVVEEHRITTALDPYFALPALSAYSGISVRTLRDRLPSIPHYKLPGVKGTTGKILVRRSEFDQWMEAFKITPAPAPRGVNHPLDQIIAEARRRRSTARRSTA